MLASLARNLAKGTQREEACCAAEEALALSRRSGDLATQASALMTLAMCSAETSPGGLEASPRADRAGPCSGPAGR